MTTINTIQDLIRLLRDQPEWAEEVRTIIMTRELLELPATVKSLADSVESLAQSLQETNQRLERLENRVDRIDGRVGRISGSEYERSVEQGTLARTIQDLGFGRARVAMSQHTGTSPAFHSVIDQALETGALAPADISSIFDTDLIIRSGDDRYALCEISVTADTEDISRAAERAEILSKALKCQVTPVIVADTVHGPQQQQARAVGVNIFIIPNR